MLSLLGLRAELVNVDLPNGEHKQPPFLAKNSFGQVPVLEDGALTLSDSNAILVYLGERYDEAQRYWPRDPARRAQVQRWLSIAAGQLAAGPARCSPRGVSLVQGIRLLDQFDHLHEWIASRSRA